MLPSDLCTDAEFIRRVYLDLTGLPPQPEEVRAFLADTRPTQVKRDELIDKLVGSPDYVEHVQPLDQRDGQADPMNPLQPLGADAAS